MFSPAERRGMIFPMIAGCLSAIAASLVLFLALRRWHRRTSSKSQGGPDASVNIIFLNLILADFIQSLGKVAIVWWLTDGVVTEGRLCTAQAVLKQVGADGVAFSSMAVAVHTFCVLILRWRAPKYISTLVVFAIWISIALIVTIPYVIHRKERLYGSVGYWCFVRREFKTEQLFTEYIWLWVSVFFMAILYTIMFTVMRGWFIVENGVWYWYKNHMPKYDTLQPAEEEKDMKAIATLLLLFPLPYFISVFPHSVARWLFYFGHHVKYQVTFFTTTLFALSGTFNAILFFYTRPDLVVDSSNSLSPPFEDTKIRDKEPITPSPKFGSLPSRSPMVFDFVTPPFEGNSDGQFHSCNSIPLKEGTNNNIHAPPRRMESELDSYSPHWTGKRSHGDFRSKSASDAPVEEESYGYLPH